MNLARRVACVCALSGIMVAGGVAGGFQLNESGARAMAQAGAFAARAHDGSAIYFNPAGLAFQNRASFYGGATAIVPVSSFFGPLQNNTNQKTESPNQFFNPINAYFTYPAAERVHVGFGVNNPYGLGSKWPENWVGRYVTTEVELQTFYFTPTVSVKLLDNLSLGAGFNYATGSVSLKRAVFIPLTAAGGDPTITMDLSGTGMGWNAGLLYKLTPEVALGVSYRSPVKFDAKGSAAFKPNYAVLGLPQGDVSTSITLPGTGFAGIAYTPAEGPFEIEADVQYIGWSSYDQLDFAFKSNGSHVIQPKKYKDTFILRMGGEYSFGSLHLRGGYLYDRSPVQTAFVDPMLPDANRNGINVGLGYDISDSFTIDLAYLLLLFNERTAEHTEIAMDGTYHTRVHLMALNFGYSL